tara:strand:- start:122 stop:463 length:342 start_codon:yes stop_codon:yes gene_type:complete
MISIYHNPRCRKSREALAYLKEISIEFKTIEYFKSPLSPNELKAIIDKLGIHPAELIRREESLWKSQYKDSSLSNQDLIELMISEPRLMQRPIVVYGDKAVIARNLEAIKDLF